MFSKIKKLFKKDQDTDNFLRDSYEEYFYCRRYYAGKFVYYKEIDKWCENNCNGSFFFDCPMEEELDNGGIIRGFTTLWFSEYDDFIAFNLAFKNQLEPLPYYTTRSFVVR